MPPKPDIISEVFDHMLITVKCAGGVITHPEIIPVGFEPLRKIPAFHAIFYLISNK
jgi:hypothetical protein